MSFQERTTSLGNVERIWEPDPMPRFWDAYLDDVFFVYPSKSEAERGDPHGGSGVFIGMPFETIPSRVHTYAITNRHVIDEIKQADSGGNPIIRLNDYSGGAEKICTKFDEWRYIPNHDVAVRMFSGQAKS